MTAQSPYIPLICDLCSVPISSVSWPSDNLYFLPPIHTASQSHTGSSPYRWCTCITPHHPPQALPSRMLPLSRDTTVTVYCFVFKMHRGIQIMKISFGKIFVLPLPYFCMKFVWQIFGEYCALGQYLSLAYPGC